MYQQSAREGSRISCSRDAGSVGSQNTEVARRRSPSHFQSGCSWASRKRAIRTAPLITSAWPHNSDRVEATRGLPAGPWSGSPQSCGEIWIRSASRNCRRQLIKLHPPRSLSTARIWSISCSNWFNAPKHWTTITKPCSGSSNRRPLGGLSAPKWLWLPSTRRRRNRMKSIRNSISNACWALSQLPSC